MASILLLHLLLVMYVCDLNSEDVVVMKIFLSWVKPKVQTKNVPHIDIQKHSRGLTDSCKYTDKSTVTEFLCYKVTGVSQHKKNNCISFTGAPPLTCASETGGYIPNPLCVYVCVGGWGT